MNKLTAEEKKAISDIVLEVSSIRYKCAQYKMACDSITEFIPELNAKKEEQVDKFLSALQRLSKLLNEI